MRTILLIFCLITVLFDQADPASFDLQGHRGCRGLMPENTVPAFLKALDLGVTTLEMDVVISNDKQVVVSHDPYFNAAFSTAPDGHLLNKKDAKNRVLYQMNYAEIKRYDVGATGNSAYPEQTKIKAWKPLLSDVIEQAESYRKRKNLPVFGYNIEIKSDVSAYNKSQPEPAAFCDLVQAILQKAILSGHITPDRITIQSFDFAVLRRWKQQADSGDYPKVRLSALVANLRSPEKNIDALGFTPAIYSPYYRLVSQKKIRRLHNLGVQVIPWTVNQRDDMKRLKAWGVDGLITDYPDRATGL